MSFNFFDDSYKISRSNWELNKIILKKINLSQNSYRNIISIQGECEECKSSGMQSIICLDTYRGKELPLSPELHEEGKLGKNFKEMVPKIKPCNWQNEEAEVNRKLMLFS